MSSGYAGRTVLVTGAGISGTAAAGELRRHGATVLLADRSTPASIPAGVQFIGLPERPPPGVELVVTSPGWRPDDRLLLAAAAAGIEVIGEVELAWRIGAAAERPVPWLAVTGTNGKTTTVALLESILLAAGLRAVAAGNVGLPVIEALRGGYDVLAVELSSFQLHWARSLRPVAAAVLNVADDHLDWHGDRASYAAAKASIYGGGVAIFNADDPGASRLAADQPHPVGYTLDRPSAGQLGVEQGRLIDRAFGDGDVLAAVTDLQTTGAHNVANALAAAALARAHGVMPLAVQGGLQAFRPGAHRNAVVSTVDGVAYVDDSKATNPHAAAASLAAYDEVVWIAGGLLKGAQVDDLVQSVAARLVAVVLLGADRATIAAALARHAPDVPVVEVHSTDDVAMDEVVRAAARMASPGQTVLLAPAAASMDMFSDYAARGRAFAAAVAGLAAR